MLKAPVCGSARLPAAERGCCLILPEPEPEPEPRCAAYWRSPIPGMLSPLYGKLALRILGGLAHFRRKPTELAIRTDAPAHRRLSLPSATQEPVHHAPCSLRLAGTRPTMSGRNGDAKEAKDIVYTGKEPFEKFDRQVNRWARRRFKASTGIFGSAGRR